MSDSINFAWYLMTWLTGRFGDERTFWKTMTPVRCEALYQEYARKISPVRQLPAKKENTISLSQYILGGG